MATLKHILLILYIYLPEWITPRQVYWQQIYKGQLKTFGYQKVILIQRMDILHHQFIFHGILTLKNSFKNFSSDNDLKSKLEENNQKTDSTKNIPVALLFIFYMMDSLL